LALAALIIAIVAAVVALLSFLWSIGWSIYQHRRTTRGRLLVSANLAYVPGTGVLNFSVTATNDGLVPVTVNSVNIEIPRVDERLVIVSWLLENPAPLAHLLSPGASWFGIADLNDIRRQVARVARTGPPWKVRVGVKDAAGRTHYAPRIRIE
jgi:hypothetical protein